MKLEFFKSKTGNWVCPAANDELIVANGSMTEKEITTALEQGEGRKVGTNLLIGFGTETISVTAKAVKGKAADEASKPEIEWEAV
jgi:hypothetical protein